MLFATRHIGRSPLYEQYGKVSHTALGMAARPDDGKVSGQARPAGLHCCARGRWLKEWALGIKWPVVPILAASAKLLYTAAKNSVVRVFLFRCNLLTMNRRKSASLGALVLQTSVLALTIRYSRTQAVSGPRYLTSTAVVMSELIKLLTCLYIFCNSAKSKGWVSVRTELLDVKEAVKTAVPSGIYTLQNNLQFVAVSNLDAATFQVTYQLKILTTAVFSVLFLHRQLDCLRWSALLLLTVGVALVQFPSSEEGSNKEEVKMTTGSTLVGLAAVLTMCISSGFAGVFFEKILKASSQSLWARNVQMALFSVLLGLVAVVVRDGNLVMENGFFQGYNMLTIVIVLQQAVLGLIISLVVKYADNILKGFASAISITFTAFISYVFLNDLQPTGYFLVGSGIVMASVLMYSMERRVHTHTTETVV